MNKNELKKVLKPLIKECIREVIFEDGSLSTIISEVLRATDSKPIVESKKPEPKMPKRDVKKALDNNRKQLLDAIGKDSYNGVNIFENVEPMSSAGNSNSAPGPLSGVSPNDPGVDISAFMGHSSQIWNKMKGK